MPAWPTDPPIHRTPFPLATFALAITLATSPALKKKIAEKKHVVANGPVDLAAGRAIAQGTCLICHQFHGEGIAVGPDLTGSGRSNLDALLNNVLDPDQIIGRGYENVIIDTKDGLAGAGRLVSENDSVVRLLGAADVEHVVEKDKIAKRTVTENSMMPGGFAELPDTDFRNLMWYILNPPQDKRPLTAELRAQLVGDPPPAPAEPRRHPPVDMESVALWNPAWKVVCPPFDGAPNVEAEFHGRKNVLRTHPIDRQKACALERVVKVPADASTAKLEITATTHDHGQASWLLRVLADGKKIHEQLITKEGGRWKKTEVDLTPLKGREVLLRLENAANDWMFEFGYWGEIKLDISSQKP